MLPAFIFSALYAFFDRPRWKDRYASLILGLGVIAFVGFAVPFFLALTSTNIITPSGISRWIISILIRGLAGGFMWWLLWIYLTPARARIRLGRFGPTHRGSDD